MMNSLNHTARAVGSRIMLKDTLYRVTLGLAAFAAIGAGATVFAQNGAEKSGAVRPPLSAPSIRPFQRSEISTSEVPNLYDKSSDEFDYFRDELGRSETSTKTKKRLEEIESRVVYADPMDKPAFDNTKFINIYDDVYSDGAAFVDPSDPDVLYSAEEHNILAQASLLLKLGTLALSARTGGQSSGSSGYGSGYGSSMGSGGMYSSSSSYPTPSGSPGMGSSRAQSAPVVKSEKDDSELLFPESVDNPYEAKNTPVADEAFDFFKADREFSPKETTSSRQGSYGSGYMGSSSDYMGSSSDNMGSPGSP